jgi:hypothetical protein
MNDSLRDDSAGPPTTGPNGPAPVMTAAAAATCPQCGTQLRLLKQATLNTPIACCICGTTFYIQPVETAPLEPTDGRLTARGPSSFQVRNTGAGGSGSRPAFRVISPPPPSVNRPPQPAERRPRSPDEPPPTMSAPPPPPPTEGTRGGMPKPVELPDHLSRGFRTSWMESVLGAVLVLLLVVAVCAGGFFVIHALWARHVETRQAQQRGSESSVVEDTKPADDGKATPAPAGDVPAPVFGPPKALPRPEVLFGTWESRVDDGSQSSFLFRPDGTVTIEEAIDRPPTHTNWYLAERKGDDLVIELGGAFGTMNNTRMTLHMTSPDAFTLTKNIRIGIVQAGGELRYVRAATAPPAPAKPAAKPAETPAAKPAAGLDAAGPAAPPK